MEDNVLGTDVHPADFAEAASKHGRHFARYLRAAPLAAGTHVLDAACGGGFGSAYLATIADSVVGLDLDDDLLALARATYAGDSIEFRRHDLNFPIEGDRQFDLITSFETLEHVRDARTCLANMAAALAVDGTAVVSVPNGMLELRKGDHKDYHKTHFSAEQFEALLSGQFESVELFSQVLHRGLGHYVRKWTGQGKHHARDYRFTPGLDENAKTWLAVCREPRR